MGEILSARRGIDGNKDIKEKENKLKEEENKLKEKNEIIEKLEQEILKAKHRRGLHCE
jgi:hypothetical protein